MSEFQCVVLAGGRGNRLYPLTEQTPKPLLPVANRPLLCFQLELLERAGAEDVIVVTTSAIAKDVSKYVNEFYKGKLKPDIAVLDDFCGTADALRQISDRIRKDFIIISGDVVTDVFIHYLADIHRSQDAAMTVLLHEREDTRAIAAAAAASGRDAGKKKKKKKTSVKPKADDDDEDDISKQYIGLDQVDGVSRLVYLQSAVDVEDEIVISKHVLRRHPNMLLRADMEDVHLYIFARWVIDLIKEKEFISSIQGELLPYLVRLQFATSRLKKPWSAKAKQCVHQDLAFQMSHAVQPENDDIRCYAHVAPYLSYCARANTVPRYIKINREIALGRSSDKWAPIEETNYLNEASEANPKAVIGNNCVVGKDAKIGSSTSIKKSVIGNHCKIGDNVKISNSIVMDHVNIEDKCQIQNSVICRGADIHSKSVLVDVQIGVGFEVQAKSNLKGDVLCNSTT